jgi:hypothetical protein
VTFLSAMAIPELYRHICSVSTIARRCRPTPLANLVGSGARREWQLTDSQSGITSDGSWPVVNLNASCRANRPVIPGTKVQILDGSRSQGSGRAATMAPCSYFGAN